MSKENSPNPMFRSIGIRGTSVNPGGFSSSRSQYDINFNNNLAEQRAANQGFWDAAGNIALRLVGRTGMSALETGAMLGYGLPKAVVTGDLNSLFDNELTDNFKKLDKVLIDNSPFYQSEAERNAPLFSKTYLTSSNFWGNLIGEGGGFVAGAMLGGVGIGKTLSTANRFAKSAGIIASDAEKIVEVANSVKTPGTIADKFLNLARNTSAKNAAAYYTQRIGGNMYESGVEARGIKDEILRQKEESFKKENPGIAITEAQKAEWENIASLYSNVGFGLNMALLMIDGFNLSKFLKGYSSTNRVVNALHQGGKYIEKGKYGKFADATKAFLGGPLSEAAQEGGQFLTEKTLSDIAEKDTQNSKQSFNDYFMSTIKGLEQTFGSKEGQESMLAGFLLSTPFNIKQGIETGQLDKEGINVLNKFAANDVFRNTLKHNMEAYDKNVGLQKDEAALNNSRYLHENIKRSEWLAYVKNRDQAGRFDDVIDDIYREKNLPLNVFKEVHGEDYTEEKRQVILNELEKQARYYKKVSDEVNSSFTSHPNKDALIEASVNINNYSQRIAELQGKLTNNTLPAIIKAQIQTDIDSLLKARTEEELKLADYLTLKSFQTSESIPQDNKNTIEKVTIDGVEGIVERKNEGNEENPEPTLVVSTPSGKVVVPEKDLDNNLQDGEDTYEEPEYDDFEGDITPDVPKSEGKGAKWMVLDTNDPEANWLNFGDIGLKDYREQANNISDKHKNSELHKSLVLNADKADAIKDDIIDNGTQYSFEYKKEIVSGKTQYNIYAKKGNSRTKVGFILNFETARASKSEYSIDEYLDLYMQKTTPNVQQKKGVISRIREADKKLKSSNVEDVTNAVSLSTRIKRGTLPSKLSAILDDEVAKKRWLVNGELVIVKYQKGNYVPITQLSQENKKLLLNELQKESNKSFLGTQYAILVKRPSKTEGQYAFVGFKGTKISTAEKNSFIRKMKDPNVDKETLVKEMNERMFITGEKSFVVYTNDGQKVVNTHLFFDTDFKGNVIIRREPKLLDGQKSPITFSKRTSKAIVDPDAIANYIAQYAYERISGENANNFEYVKDRIETNADPSLWRSFFKFSHNIYGDKPKNVNTSLPTATPTETEEGEKPVQVYTKDGVTAKIYSKYSIQEMEVEGKKILVGTVDFTATRSDKPDVPIEGGYLYDDERGNALTSFTEDYNLLIDGLVEGLPEERVSQIRVVKEIGYFDEKENKNLQNVHLLITDIQGNTYKHVEQVDVRKFLPPSIEAPKTSKFSAEILKKIQEIKKNANFIKLDKSKKFYIDTRKKEGDPGYKLTRVTDFIIDEESTTSEWFESSTTIGTKSDDLVRDFFDGSLQDLSKYDVSSDEEIKKFLLQLETLDKQFKANNETVLANNIVLYDEKLGIAGTVDLLTVDAKGNFRIYDMKTMRGDHFKQAIKAFTTTGKELNPVSKYEFKGYYDTNSRKYIRDLSKDSNKEKHQKQLSMYRLLLNNTHGVLAKNLFVIPIEVDYEIGDVRTGKLNMLPLKELPAIDNIKDAVLSQQRTTPPSQEFPTTPVQGTASINDFFGGLSNDPDDPNNPSAGFQPTEAEDYLVTTYFEEVNRDIKKILNVEVKLEDSRDSMGRLLNYGKFENGIVYLASKAPKGTLWHEAFHGVFSILPENEKKNVLKIAFDKLGVTDTDVANLKKVYIERGYSNLSDKFLVEKVLEEKVADLFQDYMNNRPTGIFQRFFKMLSDLINYLLGKTNDPVFKAFFKQIEGGKYRHVTPGGEVVSFKTIPYANSLETDNLMNLLTAQYLNRKTTEPDTLYEFVLSRLEDVRRGYDKKIRDEYASKFAMQEKQLADNFISQEEYTAEINRLKGDIASKFIRDDKTNLVFPKFLAPKYEKSIINQVIQYADFKKIREEGDEDDEVERVRSFSESEFDKAVHMTPAGQAVKAKFKTLMIDDPYFREVPINAYGIFNNLLFNLNGVAKKDIEAKLESLVSDSVFGKSIAAILYEYRTDETFKTQMMVAFDRMYANAFKVVVTKETVKNQNFAKLENGDDYIEQQLNDWRAESLANRNPNIRIVDTASLLENLGITITDDAMQVEEVSKALTQLTDYLMFNLSGSIDPFSDTRSKTLLEEIATYNIATRDDLGELNFKNAEGKPQSSIINSSYIFKKLNAIDNKYLGKMKDNWGIYVGSKFSSKTTDYKHIDPKTYMISSFALYRDAKGPLMVLQQPSDKSTIPLIRGQKFNIEDVPAIIMEEKARQDILIQNAYQKVLKALDPKDDSVSYKNLIADYHYVKVKGEPIITSLQKAKKAYEQVLANKISRSDKSIPRGFKYYNLPDANDIKGEYTLSIAQEALNKMINLDVENIKSAMSDFNITDDDIKRLGIKNVKTFLQEFSLNQYVNRMILLSEISPDLGLFKDFTDITKRGAGLMASGPDHYVPGKAESFQFAIIPDRQKGFQSSVKDDDEAETLDAQGFELAEERLNRLERIGRITRKSSLKNDEYDEMYQNYLTLQAIIDDDRELIRELENKNAPLNVDKTVGYGDEFYIKTSVKVLTRYFSSEVAQPGDVRVINGVEYTSQQDTKNGKWYLPIHGREFEWNLINEMQQKNISAAFAQSAIKKGAKNISEYTVEDTPGKLSLMANNFSYMDYRLQQENKASKEQVVDGSQNIQLIDSNLPLDTKLPDGRNVKKVREENDRLISEIKEYQKNLYLNGMENFNVGDKKYSAFVNYITSSLSTSGATDRILEFFEGDGEGGFKFSTSMPMIEGKFEELLMAYFNNNIAKHKVPGDKFTLSSSEFYKKVTDKNGNVLTTYEYMQLSDAEKDELVVEELAAPNQQNTYAEIVISEQYLDQLGITIEDWVRMKGADPDSKEGEIFKKISTFMGYRIPTQAHHSMLPCKIVDFMPREFGSTIILPAEVTKLSGADYDVDSLFVHRYSVYKDSEGNLQLHDNTKESVEKAAIKNPLVKELLKVYKEEEKRAIRKEIIKAYRKLGELKEKRAAGEKIGGQIRIQKDIIFDLEKREENIDIESLSEIMKFLGMAPDVNPNKIFNDLLDNRLNVLTSEQGRYMINYPAEDHFKGLHQKVFSKHPNFNDEKKFSTYANFSTFFDEWNKVFSGGKAIGGAANMNKVFAFLIKNSAYLRPETTRIHEFYNYPFDMSEVNERDRNIIYENGEFKFTDEVIRPKSDTLSNNVSITVDNAKDQTLIKFNLSDKNISEASVLAGLGFGRNRIAAFFLNPITKLISNKLILSDSILNKNYQTKEQQIEGIISKFSDDVPVKQVSDDDLLRCLSLDYKKVYSLLTGNKKYSELTEEEQDILTIQVNLGRLYKEIATITADAFTVNTVLNYNKEIGRYLYEMDKFIGSVNKIKKSPVFSIGGIQSNEFMQNVLGNIHEMRPYGEKNLLSYNRNADIFFSDVIDGTSKDGFSSSDQEFQAKIRREFIRFLAMKTLAFYEGDKIVNPKEFPINDISVITGERVVAAFEKAKPLLIKSPLGSQLKIVEPSPRYPFPRVGAESFSNIDRELKQLLIDSFDDFLRDSNENIRQLGLELLYHIAAHDNFKYVSDSVIGHISPGYFGLLNRIYKGVPNSQDVIGLERIFNGSSTYAEFKNSIYNLLMGKTEDERHITVNGFINALKSDFVKHFFADPRNSMFIKTVEKLNKEKRFYGEVKNGEQVEIVPSIANYVKDNDTYVVNIKGAPRFPFVLKYFMDFSQFGISEVINNIYSVKSIFKVNPANPAEEPYTQVIYTRHIMPKTDKEFNTRFYQLRYDDNVKLLDVANSVNEKREENQDEDRHHEYNNIPPEERPEEEVFSQYNLNTNETLPKENTELVLKKPTDSRIPEYWVDENLLKNKNKLAITKSNKIIVAKGVTPEIFYKYLEGNDSSPTSLQKKEVLKYMEQDGWPLSRIQETLNTQKKIYEFLILHEHDHLINNDSAVYWQNGRDLMSLDKIEIEARASINALDKIAAFYQETKPTPEVKKIIVPQNPPVQTTNPVESEVDKSNVKKTSNPLGLIEPENPAEFFEPGEVPDFKPISVRERTVNKIVDNFEIMQPVIKTIRGYKNVETVEDFLNLPPEKQETLIMKICKSYIRI
jgi:hypothetical protein